MSTLDDFKASTLQAAQANVLAAITAEVADLNGNLKKVYMDAFNGWLVSWNAGRVSDSSTAPKPPMAFVVGSFTDTTSGAGTVGAYGPNPIMWATPQMGTAPVCDMPQIPVLPVPQSQLSANKIHVGRSLGQGWWSAGTDDTFPSGQTTPPVTSDDGATGVFVKYGAPVGAGWYLKQ